MKIKLITLKLKDNDFSYLKKLKKDLFLHTNNPSFNLIEPFVILGKTDLQSFNNLKIKAIETPLCFNSLATNNNNVCFIDAKTNESIEYLQSLLCNKTVINFKSKYFNLLEDNDKYPIIHLGNAIKNDIKVNPIVISDYRIELLEIIIMDNKVTYRVLDSIHLSMDKDL